MHIPSRKVAIWIVIGRHSQLVWSFACPLADHTCHPGSVADTPRCLAVVANPWVEPRSNSYEQSVNGGHNKGLPLNRINEHRFQCAISGCSIQAQAGAVITTALSGQGSLVQRDTCAATRGRAIVNCSPQSCAARRRNSKTRPLFGHSRCWISMPCRNAANWAYYTGISRSAAQRHQTTPCAVRA